MYEKFAKYSDNESGSVFIENIFYASVSLILVIFIRPFIPFGLWVILLIIVPVVAFFIPEIDIRGFFESRTSSDINAKDAKLAKQLIRAAEKGLTDKVRSFLEIGADINAKDDHGDTALICAALKGRTETVKFLIENGADTIKTRFANTPLLCAASRGHTETVKILSDFGADVNARNTNGDNALRVAAWSGHTETVKFLIDKNAYEEDQSVAFIHAASKGHINIMKFLIDHGIDINVRAGDKWWNFTPLIRAAAAGETKAVNYLLERGADINAMDNDGMTALKHAKVNNRTNIVKILKKAGAVD